MSDNYILLFLNGLYWKSVRADDLIITRLDDPVSRRYVPGITRNPSIFPLQQGGDLLVPVLQSDVRVLEHWLPQVGIHLVSGRIGVTDPIPFDLKVAIGTPDKPEYIMAFNSCLVDTKSKEWKNFETRVQIEQDEIPPMWLSFTFTDYIRERNDRHI